MKLKIETYNEANGGGGYIGLWIDNNFWWSIITYKDNNTEVIDSHKIKQDQG